MDPKDPFKICLYPSTRSQDYDDSNPVNTAIEPDELESLILHNYLILKRDCLQNQF
jgi:hypothetical protein